jgi:hypothetical protein
MKVIETAEQQEKYQIANDFRPQRPATITTSVLLHTTLPNSPNWSYHTSHMKNRY